MKLQKQHFGAGRWHPVRLDLPELNLEHRGATKGQRVDGAVFGHHGGVPVVHRTSDHDSDLDTATPRPVREALETPNTGNRKELSKET